MKKYFLFVVASLFVQTVLAQADVKLVPRVPPKGDPDRNKWVLEIDGKTKLMYEEMQGIKVCIGRLMDDIPLMDSVRAEGKVDKNAQEEEIKLHTAKILELTEAPSISELYTIMKNKTCWMYKHQELDLILTTPTNVGLDSFVEGPLADCLFYALPVKGARKAFSFKVEKPKTAEEIEAEELEKHCPDDEAKKYREDKNGNPIESTGK